MAGKILLRPYAEDDLIEIWLYIASDNENAVEQLLQRIDFHDSHTQAKCQGSIGLLKRLLSKTELGSTSKIGFTRAAKSRRVVQPNIALRIAVRIRLGEPIIVHVGGGSIGC